MSYILEALKKVEQKQQREGAPRLLTLPPDVPEQERKSRVWPYVITGGLVLNAGIMIAWWIAPWQRYETITPAVEPVSMQEKTLSVNPDKASASTVYSHSPGRSSSGQTAPEISEKVTSPLNPATPIKTEETSPSKEKTGVSTASHSPEAQSRKEAKTSAHASGNRLFDLRDLPPTVRGSLPEFKISGHAYSPESRFRVARVNNKIVQEGEVLNQGLRIDEIVPEGVIFTYQGYRFRVSINDNP